MLKLPTVKLKNLKNETALEMRKDTQKDNADFIKKKSLLKKVQHLNAFSFSSGNKRLTRRKAEPILCSFLKRQIQRMEEVTGRMDLFPP